MLWLLALLSLIGINAAAVAAFAIDKRRAIEGEWRIAESTLLTLALIGGSPGALWARARFRHKTRKQPFATQLDLIAMIQSGLVFGLAAAFLI
ncbi:DUF1294 domain-containing protein [Sphingomonas sp. SUN019]|uniref:DUF1294 domain-containing protein n=1 Tax=Sphingomonas sp. SUN019 TaxID=2937788 RepID=UPI002164D439|nr:DUF1294 domain-containing protein [Sphingomonas sp. SUN019]UVO50240.1 DUF1294 domain-containing protein [Sphingomonas sp. SUN019]